MDTAPGNPVSKDRLRRALAAGELLFSQGQPGDAAFVIESGAIEIFSEHEGDRRLIAKLGANDIFGEMALLGDAIRTASAAAVEPTLLMVVTHEHLQERMQAADPMTRHLLRTVVIRCRELLSKMRLGHDAPVVRAIPSALSGEEEEAQDRDLAFGRLRTERELEAALEAGEFQLYFQPIVRMANRRIAGFESLIRWFKPGHGLVPPGEFIPVAEASPLINRIGLWIIRSAVDSLLALDDVRTQDGTALFLTVNLSARQLTDPALANTLAEQLRRLKGRRCELKMEVTESLMIGNVADAQAFVALCRKLGVAVVLDDFGTGYCSLSYLHLFDVQAMKLDRSFIRGMAVSPASEKVVKGVTHMAHDLGLEVVAEGIERPDEAEQAAMLGIDYAQGYFFGRPAKLADALQRLASSP